MKKIVGIFAAAAVLATSVFAADVSAGVRLEGSLFDYNGGISALTISHNNQYYHAPIAFSISDDKAGGTLKLTDQARGNATKDKDGVWSAAEADAAVKSSAWNIWFKPADMLKVTLGCFKNTLNQEQIGWWRTQSGIGDDGGAKGSYVLTLTPVDGLSIDLSFTNDFGKAWMSKPKDGDASIAELGLMMHYGADFGTIGAVLDANANFKDLKFGASYANTIDPVFFFVNVLGFYNNSFNKVRAELFGKYAQDALKLQLFVPVDVNLGDKTTIAVGAVFRLDYTMDGYTLYVEAEDGNFLADKFSMSIKPGVLTNVGLCAIEAQAAIGIGESVTFSVPVNFKVSF